MNSQNSGNTGNAKNYVVAFFCKKEPDNTDPCIESAIHSHIHSESMPVDDNGLISDDVKDRIDFLSGVSLLLCIIANANRETPSAPYPSTNEVLGDLTDYYAYIKDHIYQDLSGIHEYHTTVFGMLTDEQIPSIEARH